MISFNTISSNTISFNTISFNTKKHINTMRKHTRRAASEYHEERNRDLLRVYKQALLRKDLTQHDEILKATVMTPAQRFYVSEERAVRVVNQWLAKQCSSKMLPMQRMMYAEIVRRVKALRRQRPNERINRLVWEVIAQPAPRFYLTEKSAYVILRKIKKR